VKGTVWLAWALGVCCAVLLALGLILFYANGFTTMMIFNRPDTGFRSSRSSTAASTEGSTTPRRRSKTSGTGCATRWTSKTWQASSWRWSSRRFSLLVFHFGYAIGK